MPDDPNNVSDCRDDDEGPYRSLEWPPFVCFDDGETFRYKPQTADGWISLEPGGLTFFEDVFIAPPEPGEADAVARVRRDIVAVLATKKAKERGRVSEIVGEYIPQWSVPKSVEQWAKIFGDIHRNTMVDWFKTGKVKNLKLSTKMYRVHAADLPADYRP